MTAPRRYPVAERSLFTRGRGRPREHCLESTDQSPSNQSRNSR
ncbi:hypothetical protein NJ7G_2021 [Natrinema sp. J7-2]|nr:hypothetical protein NJ7G_2021 [Natrinema sp. J7-2]